jgi:cell fate (sporulation/competence/biofilm development) regulator YlbF (YheA/YmcA/DUF963 family)
MLNDFAKAKIKENIFWYEQEILRIRDFGQNKERLEKIKMLTKAIQKNQRVLDFCLRKEFSQEV